MKAETYLKIVRVNCGCGALAEGVIRAKRNEREAIGFLCRSCKRVRLIGEADKAQKLV